jgi:hypothetical protein
MADIPLDQGCQIMHMTAGCHLNGLPELRSSAFNTGLFRNFCEKEKRANRNIISSLDDIDKRNKLLKFPQDYIRQPPLNREALLASRSLGMLSRSARGQG